MSDATIQPLDRPGPESKAILDAGVFSTMENRELGPAMIASRTRIESSLLSVMFGTPQKNRPTTLIRGHIGLFACQQVSADALL